MKNIEQEVNSTLNSLDDITRATPPPYFNTRLEQRWRNSQERVRYGRMMPVLAAALVLFLILNVLSFFKVGGETESSDGAGGIVGFATEYNLSESEPF
jgi:hypothetical protein